MNTFNTWLESQDIMQKMGGYLNQLGTNFALIAHQTFEDSAASIMKGRSFGRNGLEGTALFVSPQQIIQTVSAMGGIGQAAIHRGSNAVVVMAVPKEIINKYKIRSMNGFDEHLINLNTEGKIQDLGLPQQFIVGYFSKGQFFANSRFNPDTKILTTSSNVQ